MKESAKNTSLKKLRKEGKKVNLGNPAGFKKGGSTKAKKGK